MTFLLFYSCILYPNIFLSMPSNTECSLGLTAFKKTYIFKAAIHDIGTSLTHVTNFSKVALISGSDMKYANFMDCVLVKIFLFPPNTCYDENISSPRAAAVTTRSKAQVLVSR